MISPALQNLIDEGMELKKSVLSCLSSWPLDQKEAIRPMRHQSGQSRGRPRIDDHRSPLG